VSDVLALHDDQIRPAPTSDPAVGAPCITGIAAVTSGDVERNLTLVDIERLMAGVDMSLVVATRSLH
jgi:chemotaxis signal transduction protein